MNVNAYLQSYHAQLAISRSMEVEREEYLDYMTFKANKRPLFTEIFGPLLGLKEEWTDQGASPSELDFSAFPYRRPMWGSVPVKTGWLGGPEPVLLEDTAEFIIYRDEMGRKMKLSKKAATLALPLSHPVKTMADWLKIKPHYEFYEERFGKDWEAIARQHLQAGKSGDGQHPRWLR